jgi:hypothetical protein
METTQLIIPSGKATKILTILSTYPILWTVAILVYALVKSSAVYVGIMMTWVLYVYFGSFTWFGLLIYLNVKKKITLRQTLTHALIVAIGILIAYYVVEYDVLSSGVKYMD